MIVSDVVEYPSEPLGSGNFVAYDRTYCVVYNQRAMLLKTNGISRKREER